jgi:hypothetical protein
VTAQKEKGRGASRRRGWVPIGSSVVYSSCTRIAPLRSHKVALEPLGRERWEEADYVVGTVTEEPSPVHTIESTTGRMVDVFHGDLVVGALGNRFATLEVVGDWRSVGADLEMHALTRAGVFGRCTSSAPFARPHLVPLRYLGHLTVDGRTVGMPDFVRPIPHHELTAPVVLLIGTSMSAGKTTTARTVIRVLKQHGLRVGAAKLTGVARYREVLTMQDAGADHVVDFVDAGLPSSAVPAATYRGALAHMTSSLARAEVDVVVAEAGASPLEPYNVELAIAELGGKVRCTILCASDPYAVVGVSTAFGIVPDLVAGRATSTTAGVALAERLSGVRALDLLEKEGHALLDVLLRERLGLE